MVGFGVKLVTKALVPKNPLEILLSGILADKAGSQILTVLFFFAMVNLAILAKCA